MALSFDWSRHLLTAIPKAEIASHLCQKLPAEVSRLFTGGRLCRQGRLGSQSH